MQVQACLKKKQVHTAHSIATYPQTVSGVDVGTQLNLMAPPVLLALTFGKHVNGGFSHSPTRPQ